MGCYHPWVQTSQLVSILAGNQTGYPQIESNQTCFLPLCLRYRDKISEQALSILPQFPIAIIVQAHPRTVEASSPGSLEKSSLMWVSLCFLTLLVPTGFGHMTVHFSGGAHDLPTMHLAETDW